MKSTKNPLSLYIHWPFCLSKCPYCDFASIPCPTPDEDALIKGYRRDLALFAAREETTNRNITTVFFGGGTPSLMSPHLLENLLSEVQRYWSLSPDCEITMEANPDAITRRKMQAFRARGVNRLSLGVQALNPTDLAFLGRRHTVKTALDRLTDATAVFPAVNMDLIYARPHQTPDAWTAELHQALVLNLTHYSLYQLTIESDTPFGRSGVRPAGDDRAATLYRLTDAIMTAAGKPAYEVSNYACPGAECRHNLTYWRGGDYMGIGPAAHGRLGLTATQNPRRWTDWLTCGPACTPLTPAEKKTERLLMGLRLRQEWFPAAGLNPQRVQALVHRGLLDRSPAGIRPTQAGTLVLDSVILDLMD